MACALLDSDLTSDWIYVWWFGWFDLMNTMYGIAVMKITNLSRLFRLYMIFWNSYIAELKVCFIFFWLSKRSCSCKYLSKYRECLLFKLILNQ